MVQLAMGVPSLKRGSTGGLTNLRNILGITMTVCLFIVYVYWSSTTSTTSTAPVPGAAGKVPCARSRELFAINYKYPWS